MAEFGNLKKFHQHLSELENCRHGALVVEANYADFLNKEKIKPYKGFFAAKAIGEIQSSHPQLPVIFAGNRKLAIVWAYNFFSNIKAKSKDHSGYYLKESAVKYRPGKISLFSEEEIRRMVCKEMPDKFTTAEMNNKMPEKNRQFIRGVLNKLEKEGLLSSSRPGKEFIWRKN
jgi:hypothetical protein